MPGRSTARFFRGAGEFRAWLQKNHARATELIVGFYKRDSGRGGITYPQALDEALCWGWIDGVRRSLGVESYCIRFTPRKKDSVWSLVNLRHFARLQKEGRVAPPGLKVFEARDPALSGLSSFETGPKELSPAFRRQFVAEKKAWAWFESQPPGYRRLAAFWVMSAKKEETRQSRLQRLIEGSAQGRRATPY